jgi:hypothetical protein
LACVIATPPKDGAPPALFVPPATNKSRQITVSSDATVKDADVIGLDDEVARVLAFPKVWAIAYETVRV